jgi:hypothetical protein
MGRSFMSVLEIILLLVEEMEENVYCDKLAVTVAHAPKSPVPYVVAALDPSGRHQGIMHHRSKDGGRWAC